MEFNETLNKMTWNAKIDASKGIKSPIVILHDDCMLEIFAYLCFSDRILIERVNKKWKRLSEKSWQQVTRFDLNKSTWGLLPTIRIIASSKIAAMKSLADFQDDSEDDDCDNDSVNEKEEDSDDYLQRIYDEMTSNGTQRTWTFIDNRVMKKVFNLCADSLTHIVFGTDDEDYYSDKNGFNYKFPTKFMTKCLQSCHKVQKIKIPHDRDWKETFSLKCLKNLATENLLELVINASYRGKDLVHLRQVLSSAVALETLKLWNVDLKAEDFNLLPNKRALKSLKFRKEKELDARKMIPILTEMRNMEICEILVMKNMNDKLLKDLVDLCPELRSLVVMAAGDVTNSGLAYLGNLSKLEKLTVSHSNSINDSVIRHFLKLKTLKCIFCPSVRDPGILDLIKKSQCLERLVVDGTGVTMKGLESVVGIMKQQKNRNLLIEVDGKKGIDEIGKLPDNLKIGYYWG